MNPYSRVMFGERYRRKKQLLIQADQYLVLTGKGIDAELNGFKFGLRASGHRAESNSAVHHAPNNVYQQSFFQTTQAKVSLYHIRKAVSYTRFVVMSPSLGFELQ